MSRSDSATELEEKLNLLAQNFYRDLKRIVEARLKLEKESISSVNDIILQTKHRDGESKKTPAVKAFTVRLESSLGEKLAQSRGTADELEDKLQDTRIAYEDKMKALDRMRAELDMRENVLVSSIKQIEAYLRAVFYFKKEADEMYLQLRRTAEEQDTVLGQGRTDKKTFKDKKESLLEAITAFQPAKLFLEKMVSDLPKYSSITDLVQHVLVLETFQEDLLATEAECSEAEESLALYKQKLAEFKRRVPMIVVAKESTILDLKMKLRNLKSEIAQLDHEIDTAIFSRVKDDSAWYDFQKWIKKLFLDSIEIRPLAQDDPIANTLNRLDRIKDFVKDGFEIMDRLKEEKRAG